MEDIPLRHSQQIILTSEDAIPLYREEQSRFAGALAPDGETCAAWVEQLDSLPVGLALDCPPVAEEGERPRTVHYISLCKEAFRKQLHEAAAFYYLRGAETFFALRAAVLALGDLSGRTVIAELNVHDDEARLEDGTELVAAVGVLQRIGVSTVVLTAPDPDSLTEALDRVAPYARLSVGVAIHSAWLRADTTLYNTELYLPVDHDDERQLLDALKAHRGGRTVARDHDDFILAPDGNNAHFIAPTVDISDEIECGHRLGESLLDAEEETGALKLVLETEEDVVALEECRYLISRPVCLCAESPELLEQGLRVFPGLALYDGTWEQEEEMLHYWEQKYGLIRL